MDTINMNNLQKTLSKNNIQLMNRSNLSSPNMNISIENGNALTLKDDGLYIETIENRTNSIKNLLKNKILGKYVIGDCNYSLTTLTTKLEKSITIPTNLTFTPKLVFVYFNKFGGGTSTTYQACFEYIWICKSSYRFFYDNDCDNTTTYSQLGICLTLNSYNKDQITIIVKSYKNVNGVEYLGTGADSKVYYTISKWIAIG